MPDSLYKIPDTLVEGYSGPGPWKAKGRLWLADLPATLSSLKERWDLTIYPSYDPGGYRGWVAPCVYNSTRAVIKLTPPGEEVEQLDALRRNQGIFLPSLLNSELGVILMEELVGTPWSSHSQAQVMSKIPLLMSGLSSLTYRDSLPTYQFLFPDYIRLITSASQYDPVLVEGYEIWKRLSDPLSPNCPLHGDLHEDQLITTSAGAIRALDPAPLLGPRAWDLEPLTRRYTDLHDLVGLQKLSDELSLNGCSKQELVYYSLLRALYFRAISVGTVRTTLWPARIQTLCLFAGA